MTVGIFVGIIMINSKMSEVTEQNAKFKIWLLLCEWINYIIILFIKSWSNVDSGLTAGLLPRAAVYHRTGEVCCPGEGNWRPGYCWLPRWGRLSNRTRKESEHQNPSCEKHWQPGC